MEEENFQEYVKNLKNELELDREIVFFCIGTDRVIGDCIGPITGSFLKGKFDENKVYGDLDNNLTYENIEEKMDEIYLNFENPYIGIIKDGAGVGKTMICKGNSSILSTMNALIPSKQENIFYVNELIKQINFNKYIVGSGIPHIYFRDYGNEQLFIHKYDSRLKIGKFFENIYSKIKLEEEKIFKLESLKKGLIQNMFV